LRLGRILPANRRFCNGLLVLNFGHIRQTNWGHF